MVSIPVMVRSESNSTATAVPNHTSMVADPDHVLQALEAMLIEVARIRLHGISEKQLAPSMADLRAGAGPPLLP